MDTATCRGIYRKMLMKYIEVGHYNRECDDSQQEHSIKNYSLYRGKRMPVIVKYY